MSTPPERREFLRVAGLTAALSIAGCIQEQTADTAPTTGTANRTATSTPGDTTPGSPTATEQPETATDTGDGETAESTDTPQLDPLMADGSSTVYPIANKAAAYWNANPGADDEEYWPHAEYGIETDQRLADYFTGRYGFEPTGERSEPRYSVTVGLSHSETGLNAVQEGRVDIGNASVPVAEAFPAATQSTVDSYVDHVIGVDGQPIVVSREIYDAGVTALTADELRGIYKGEITNWNSVGGPDKRIRTIGRPEGSGTDTAFRATLYGDPEAEISPDTRKGQNQQVKLAVEEADNAIAYLALAFVEADGPTPPVALEFEGTTYEYGRNLGATGYPLSRDLHCYTYEDTSAKEAAFLDMLLTEFGQQVFVAENDYFTLPADRRKAQRAPLQPEN